MNLLAIDTATEACSAAVYRDGKTFARLEVVGRDHTQRLLDVIAEVMTEARLGYAELNGIACGNGPGSFAGVRIAVAFTKGLALAHELPVVAVSSLAMLAQAAIREHQAAAVLAAIDARMGEVYWGCYRNQQGLAVALQPDAVAAPQAVSSGALAGQVWYGTGTGWGAHAAALSAAAGEPRHCLPGALPAALDALALSRPIFESGGAMAADTLNPLYLRNQVALTLLEQAALKSL